MLEIRLVENCGKEIYLSVNLTNPVQYGMICYKGRCQFHLISQVGWNLRLFFTALAFFCSTFLKNQSISYESIRPFFTRACNSIKGKGTQAELISRLKEQGVLK